MRQIKQNIVNATIDEKNDWLYLYSTFSGIRPVCAISLRRYLYLRIQKQDAFVLFFNFSKRAAKNLRHEFGELRNEKSCFIQFNRFAWNVFNRLLVSSRLYKGFSPAEKSKLSLHIYFCSALDLDLFIFYSFHDFCSYSLTKFTSGSPRLCLWAFVRIKQLLFANKWKFGWTRSRIRTGSELKESTLE